MDTKLKEKMKVLFMALATLFSFSALAESEKFEVGPFSGELQIQGDEIKVTSLTLIARLQYCNFLGTTCAGGPSKEMSRQLNIKEDVANNTVSFSNTNQIRLKSKRPVNRFSSCNLEIKLFGEKDRTQYEGSLKIIHNNDTHFCGSKPDVAMEIANVFKTQQPVRIWKKTSYSY